ncbi:MAG TPA: hypothetical protein DCW74_04340 [Alteromonas australica]|uniref:Uncharacterized protein n=1 Tax=Alteromonas australica TaxID=589873 RepID=A0A350P0Y3_9ALTE|nr:hypothetical protein [Alteromonas australica]|tara:strand:+ start:785 stop:1015 length:231 start_codon:yes stop_codon:yes gene_type:complete
MDAFSMQEEQEEQEEEQAKNIGFAVLIDEQGAPVIRELTDVTPPDVKSIYAMLWSIIGQITASSLPDADLEVNETD